MSRGYPLVPTPSPDAKRRVVCLYSVRVPSEGGYRSGRCPDSSRVPQTRSSDSVKSERSDTLRVSLFDADSPVCGKCNVKVLPSPRVGDTGICLDTV